MKREDEAGCRWDLGEREREGQQKMQALFIDLRATFDNLDRRVMENDEGKRNQGRNVKVRKIYRQTKRRERIGKEESREFWTKKEVR